MSSTTRPTQEGLNRMRNRMHPLCILCGDSRKDALALGFSLRTDDSVEASFDCSDFYQGYQGMLSGGVAASLMDSAMTNCLFARGIAAVTAELKIRFRHPVPLGGALLVRARLERSRKPLHFTRAEIVIKGRVFCEAEGKFMETPGGPRVER